MSTDLIFSKLRRLWPQVLPVRWGRVLNSPAGLLWGYLLIHLAFLLFSLAFSLRGAALGDTAIYRDWMLSGFSDNPTGGPSASVYPILAVVPMALAGAAGPGLYFSGWVLMVTVLNGLAIGTLTQWGRRQEAIRAAWWWLVFLSVLGFVGFSRVDGVTAPIVLIALAFGVSAPFTAAVLLSIGTWIKVWPAAVLLALFAVGRNRARLMAAGIAVTALAAGLAVVMGWLPKLLNFLTLQGDRGMQLEATFSTPWVWLSVLGVEGSRTYLNVGIGSMQVDGPGTELMSILMQPLLLLAAFTVAGLIFWALHNGKQMGGADRTELLLMGSLSLATAFIVFNKVGSPQFVLWLGPAVAAGLAYNWKEWRVPAALVMIIAVATFVVFPVLFNPLSNNHPLAVLVLTIRNLLLMVLLYWSARRLYALGKGVPAEVPKAPAQVGSS
ncbi:glycosyltransferase family 87 protein [Arthrobacter sp. B6]|uniref:glycosyltransferase 87 family protein n=1 Tax=Arthrobacter sp. B6 TaxID=1570137 RepID=UPI0008351F27